MTSTPSAAERTGRGIRVAVIDSGVAPRHPHIGPIAGGASVDLDGRVIKGAFDDLLGHGTAVMAAMQEKAPDAEYHAVRVFHRELRTSAQGLCAAIDWCLDQQMDVVNLSLGTVNAAHAEMLGAAVTRASAAGTWIVAARDAEGKPCYPGCLPDVIGVGLDWECAREAYRIAQTDGQLALFASGYPRPVPGVPPRRNLQGISFAVANACGFVIRAREAMGAAPLDELWNFLSPLNSPEAPGLG